MNFLGIGDIISSVGKVADDLFTSDEERLKLNLEEKRIKLEEKKVDAELVKGQLEINKAEAQNKSIFAAGWRPFIGWVGGFALAYQFILYPIMMWIWVFLQSRNVIPNGLPAPPIFESGQLFVIITGMLGVGGLRSFDKIKGTQTDKIKNR